MDAPSNIETECPECDDVTIHQVLKGILGKGKEGALVLDATVKCIKCGAVHHVHIRRDRPSTIPVIISEGKTSKRTTIDLPRDLVLTIQNEIEVDGTMVQVTSLEVGGNRVETAKVEDIGTIWTKRFDMIPVKVSIFKGRRTNAETIIAAPGEEFGIGDMIEIKGRLAVIESIKVEGKTLRRGSVEAREIKRIHAKEIR